MRPVTPTDLMAAARVLLAVPARLRVAEAYVLIRHTRIADDFRRDTGRLHPGFGNGTLLSLALQCPTQEPRTPGDPEYLACIATMIDAVLAGVSLPHR